MTNIFSLIKNLTLINAFLLSPFEESYIIEVPSHLDLNESGQFNINIKQNNLNDDQSLKITFPDTFILKDIHGNDDIVGTIINNNIEIKENDFENKIVSYTLNNNLIGEYSGDLQFFISTKQNLPTNTLIDGQSLSTILKTIGPNTLSFSHDPVSEYLSCYDVSLAQDESIMLYELEYDAIITNNSNEKIIANKDMSHLFENNSYIININNFDYLDTSNCVDMSYMFSEATNLQSINGLNNIDTSNVKDMGNMFNMCSNLQALDLSGFNTSNVSNMSCMFSNCFSPSISGLSNFDVSNVENMAQMFKGAVLISSLDIATWNTENVTDMSSMFSGCNKIKTLDLSNFNVNKVEDFSNMFSAMSILTSIGDISSWDTSNVKNMSSMFESCIKLKTLNVSNFNTTNVTNMHNMFYQLSAVTTIGDISNWDVSKVIDFSHFIDSCYKLNDYGDLSKWRVSNACLDTSYMLSNNSYYSGRQKYIYTIDNLDLSNWDVSNVKNMSHMFYNNLNTKQFNLSNWDVRNVSDMSDMFGMHDEGCPSQLTKVIGLNTWNVQNLKNMNSMFYRCEALADNNSFTNWNVNNVIDLSYAFYSCKYIDPRTQFSNWGKKLPANVNMHECFGENTGIQVEPKGYKNMPSWYIS